MSRTDYDYYAIKFGLCNQIVNEIFHLASSVAEFVRIHVVNSMIVAGGCRIFTNSATIILIGISHYLAENANWPLRATLLSLAFAAE
jgi:hypothetical protein